MIFDHLVTELVKKWGDNRRTLQCLCGFDSKFLERLAQLTLSSYHQSVDDDLEEDFKLVAVLFAEVLTQDAYETGIVRLHLQGLEDVSYLGADDSLPVLDLVVKLIAEVPLEYHLQVRLVGEHCTLSVKGLVEAADHLVEHLHSIPLIIQSLVLP